MTYVRAFEHTSRLLENNAMGNTHVRKVHVYLPPDYSDRRREPYPVVFLLAGWGGRGATYLSDPGSFGEPLPERLDRMIQAREIPPCIVVFPDGSTRLGASQYVNSPVNGPFMDYVCDELVEFIDERFHTHKSRDFRGIIGHSSGGFGALVSGMMRADRFAAVTSSAGDSWYEFLYTHTIPQTIEAVRAAGGIAPFVESFLACPNPMGLLGSRAVVAMLNLSMTSCFTPNVEVPVLRGDLWFDIDTGELIDEPWRRLLEWDPIRMVERHLPELRSLRFLHLESGSEDEYGLCLGHRQLARRLERHGIAVRVDEYPGKHSGHHHRMAGRIQQMVRALTST